MTKTIYRFYSEYEFKKTGRSYVALTTEDDTYAPQPPYTDVPIPDDLAEPDKVPFFRPTTRLWEDMSSDAQIIADKQQAADLAQAKQDAAEAKDKADAQTATIADLTAQLTEAQDAIVELAQATLPSTDTEQSTNQDATESTPNTNTTDGGAA